MGSTFDRAIELSKGLHDRIEIKVHEGKELPGVRVQRIPNRRVVVRGEKGADMVEVLLVPHMNHLLSVNGWPIPDWRCHCAQGVK